MRLIKIIAIFISFFFLLNAEAQKYNNKILLRINREKTTVGDFLKSYHKNQAHGIDSISITITEYLDLYINFRLKVIEAKSLRMDTISRLEKELNGYFKQLAEPYLTDKETDETLLKEAYERLKIDIRASHILIRCEKNASPDNTLKAYNKILDLRRRAMNGEDFNQLASRYSDDLSARDQKNSKRQIIKKGNGGDLGYFTVFDMVYPFETAAYKTQIGEISQPIRTRFGYHILKPTDRHEAIGDVKVAHLFLANQKTSFYKRKLKEKISLIENRLKDGESFEELVLEFSEDYSTKPKGGVLPVFGANKMEATFYLAIFEIDSNIGYTGPINTSKGWHFIKFVERVKPGNFIDEKYSLLKRIKNDSRWEISKAKAIERIKQTNNYIVFEEAKENLFKMVDSSLTQGKWEYVDDALLKDNLFKIGEQFVTQAEFAHYIIKHQKEIQSLTLSKYFQNLYNNFVNKVCENYFFENIETIYPEFKSIMDEYRDGTLLFELTNLLVWQKSMNDETGLQTFFKKNKTKYGDSKFEEIKGIVISDYQNQLEQNLLKELKSKYSVVINKRILSQLVNE